MSINKSRKKYFLRPKWPKAVLVLLFVAGTFQNCTAARHHKKKTKSVESTMTVVAIRPASNTETFVRVSFVRSQRFYKLANDADPMYFDLLKSSEKNNTPVIIKRAKEESDVILSVRKP